MSRDFLGLFLTIALGILCGLLFGSISVCLVIALFAYLYWYSRRLTRLIDWLEKKAERPVGEDSGAISEIIDEIEDLREHYRYRGDKLSGYIKQFQQATNALPDAVVVLGENDTIEGANRRATEYLNISWPQDNGQRIVNLIRHPDLNAFIKNTRANTEEKSLELALPFSEQRQLEFRLAPFSESQRLLIARDITNIHRAKEMRKDFIANASHELRSPLTVISGYLESFDDESESPPRWLPIVRQMRNQTRRMQRLIEDLLQLSALESSASHHNDEEIRVPEVLATIQKEAEVMSGNEGHIFFLEVDEDLFLKGKQQELYSAFSNLVFNAVQHTPGGGTIRIRWYKDESGAQMQVKDSGKGIPEEHISRLTERFYRVDRSRSRQAGGTGLGLAIVKHVLARHKAKLEIESTLGEGSIFTCSFPNDVIIESRLQDVELSA